jgi:hypothetical protein
MMPYTSGCNNRNVKPKGRTMQAFNFHDKRVTLTLARISATCTEIPGLTAALEEVQQADFDLTKVSQQTQELVYAHFDDALEAKIKSEFEVDSNFLIDHKGCYASCALCGQEHIRFEFKIVNLKGGQDINCGSNCIITHHLSVRGTATSEEARAALESTIRKQLKKLRIEAWHATTGFTLNQLYMAETALGQIGFGHGDYINLPYGTRQVAKRQRHALRLLKRFYERTNWLSTEKKWAEWTNAVNFARQFDATFAAKMPAPLSFDQAFGKLPPESFTEVETVTPQQAQPTDTQIAAALIDAAPPSTVKEVAKDMFSGITQQLVFGFGGKQ